MLILEMILRITGFTQEELANYLDVSRQMVNYWLNGEKISEKAIENICDKFSIPTSFFNISLNQDIEFYKLIYATIYNNWNKINNSTYLDEHTKINNILNQIIGENNIKQKKNYTIDCTDDEILDGFKSGYNPLTGEIFDDNHIINDKRIKKFLNNITITGPSLDELIEGLDELEKVKYELITKWRDITAEKENIRPRYYLLNRNEIYNLAVSTILDKEDLKRVKGIGAARYERYGDELYKLLKSDISSTNIF